MATAVNHQVRPTNSKYAYAPSQFVDSYVRRTVTMANNIELDVSVGGDILVTFDTLLDRVVNLTVTGLTGVSIGDKLILVVKCDTNVDPRGFNISSDFYYTCTADVVTLVDLNNLDRAVVKFVYDGEKYVCVLDNC